MDALWCCSGAWQKSRNCGMEKEIQPWGWGWPAVLKGHDDGDGFCYCGTARNPSLSHPSPLDGTGMLHPGVRVLSPPHTPQKCSEVGLFFVPMTRGMTAAAQGGERQHQMWRAVGTHQLSPKSHTSLSCGILRRAHVASSSLSMGSAVPRAQPEGRRGWQQKRHLWFPLPHPRNIQNEGLEANHTGAESSPRLQSLPECSSTP